MILMRPIRYQVLVHHRLAKQPARKRKKKALSAIATALAKEKIVVECSGNDFTPDNNGLEGQFYLADEKL